MMPEFMLQGCRERQKCQEHVTVGGVRCTAIFECSERGSSE